MVAGLDAIDTNNRFRRTILTAKVPRVILSTTELEETCPNHCHTVASVL